MKALSVYKVLLILLLLIPLIINAQQRKLTARITDQNSNPVAYANIVLRLGEKGIASGVDGTFSLGYTENDLSDSLWISAIGYETRKIALTQVIANPIVMLTTKSYMIQAIPVSAREAENMVKKAIDRIPLNYPQFAYTIELFFRQLHRENGKAGRLIEAKLNVYDPGYINPQSQLLKEQFEVAELRRSKVFEKNGFTHDDHLIDLFRRNIVHYPSETILNSSAIDFFHFEKDMNRTSDTTTCIKFYYQNPSDPKIHWGHLYIGNDDFAIQRMEENTTKNEEYNPRLSAASNSEWKFFEGEMTIKYKKVEGLYYLDSISFFYRHNIVNKIFGSTDYTVDEYFNFWSGMPDTVGISNSFPRKNFQKIGGMYERKYEYHPDFWKTYSFAIQHPLNSSIAAEFEKSATLEEQFLKNGMKE